MPKENTIEDSICEYLTLQGVSAEKVVSEGFWNEKRKIFQTRKGYVRNGTSDIHGTIPPYGRGLFIEVKQPKEIAKADRPSEILREELHDAQYQRGLATKTLKQYQHRVEQAEYIEEKIMHGAVAFFASSIEEVKKKLGDFGIEVT